MKKAWLHCDHRRQRSCGCIQSQCHQMAQELFSQGENNKLFVVGELGRQYFAKEGLEVDAEFKYTVQNPSLHRARVIADYVMDLYVNGELDEVYLVYTKMENSFSMNAEKQKLLPLAKEDFIHPAPADIYQEEIKVESSMEEILEHVVPNCVTGYIYGALVESFASEHNSRMMAMQTATDSARSMISQLSIEYNRVRQAAITQQITEVIGGAKAQKNKKKKIGRSFYEKKVKLFRSWGLSLMLNLKITTFHI